MEVALMKMACLLLLLRHCMKTPMSALLFKPEKELVGALFQAASVKRIRSFGDPAFVKRTGNSSVRSCISSNRISSIFSSSLRWFFTCKKGVRCMQNLQWSTLFPIEKKVIPCLPYRPKNVKDNGNRVASFISDHHVMNNFFDFV